MKRAIPWLAGVLSLGCLTLAYRSAQEKAEVVRNAQAGAQAAREAQKRIADLEQQLSALKGAKAEADRQISQLATGSPSQKTQAEHAGTGPRFVHISDIIREHPEYEALYEKRIRRNIDRMYGNGLNSLNLTPDQLSQLKNLLAERQMADNDAGQAAEAAGLQPGSAAWHAAMTQASADVEHQLSSILGSNADALLAQLQMKASIQMQVQNTYAPDFADAGIALTPEEANGLAQAMADANYTGKDTSTRPPNYNVPDPTTNLSLHDNRIIANAAPILTPAQIQLLTTDQAENEQLSAIEKQYYSGGNVIIVP
jgi:hypothetical protein